MSHLLAHLTNKGMGQLFENKVQVELQNLGYITATPQPDSIGHDLWFARPSGLVQIYLCQCKGASPSNPKKERDVYHQNINLDWFLHALHQPFYLLAYGLAHKKAPSGVDFWIGYIPGKIFRGWMYTTGSKGKKANGNKDESKKAKSKKKASIALRIKVKRDSQKRIFLLYHGRHTDDPNRDYLFEDVTKYYTGDPQFGISDCLRAESDETNHTGNYQISSLPEPYRSKRQTAPSREKDYTHMLKCQCCNTSVLFSDIEEDYVKKVVDQVGTARCSH